LLIVYFERTQAERGEEQEEVKMDGEDRKYGKDFRKTISTGRISGRQEVREGFQVDKKVPEGFKEDKKDRKDLRKTRRTGRISGRKEVPEGFQEDKKYEKDFRKTRSTRRI
jgi:hypothetical protein